MPSLDLFRDEVLTSSATIPAATVTGVMDDVFLPLVGQGEPPAAAHRQAASLQKGS
jgi:hypothetical protein